MASCWRRIGGQGARRVGGPGYSGLPVVTKDALARKHGEYEVVLANPPSGKKGSVTIVNEPGESSKESLIINRDDFWVTLRTTFSLDGCPCGLLASVIPSCAT